METESGNCAPPPLFKFLGTPLHLLPSSCLLLHQLTGSLKMLSAICLIHWFSTFVVERNPKKDSRDLRNPCALMQLTNLREPALNCKLAKPLDYIGETLGENHWSNQPKARFYRQPISLYELLVMLIINWESR